MKTPPNFPEGERAIIASCLISNDCIPTVLEEINSSDFYQSHNRTIFDAIQKLSQNSRPVDWLTLTGILKESQKLEAIGGQAYIAELIDAVPSAANVMHYVQQVKKKSTLRKIISVSTEIASKGYVHQTDSDDLLEEFQKAVFDLSVKTQTSKRLEKISEVANRTLDKIETSKELGVQSGFSGIDQKTRGFRSQELCFIGARPSMGKSALMLDIALHACRTVPVAIFSLEMSSEELVNRILAKKACINLHNIRSGDVVKNQSDMSRLMDSIGRICDYPIYLDDSGTVSLSQIKSRIREVGIKTGEKIGMLFIDYLQLMKAEGKYNSRDEKIGSITRGLKQLSKEFEIPIVCLAQLNRKVEERPVKGHGRRPQLSDFRESGSIEQDADIIFGIYRAEQYTEEDQFKGKAEVIILKQRNGPTGIVKMQWHADTATFREPAPEFRETDSNMEQI